MPTPFNVHDLALLITGSINVPDPDRPGHSKRIIIQRTRKGLGNIQTTHPYDIQIKAWKLQSDPKTPAKQANRARFAAAVTAWHDATIQEREIARPISKKRRITLFNGWISLYNTTHPIQPLGDWDNKATQWDSGNTTWDQSLSINWDNGTTTWDAGATRWDQRPVDAWDNATTIWDNNNSIWSN